MKSVYLLTDEMYVCWPEFLVEMIIFCRIAECRYVVYQCITPDVYHVPWIVGKRYPPAKRCPRDRYVFQTVLEYPEHLVLPESRLNEVWMLFEVLQKGLGVFRKSEEVVFFADMFERPSTIRA